MKPVKIRCKVCGKLVNRPGGTLHYPCAVKLAAARKACEACAWAPDGECLDHTPEPVISVSGSWAGKGRP